MFGFKVSAPWYIIHSYPRVCVLGPQPGTGILTEPEAIFFACGSLLNVEGNAYGREIFSVKSVGTRDL